MKETISEIESQIREIKDNQLLFEEKNFESRQEAVDFLSFHIIERIESLLESDNASGKLLPLKKLASEIVQQLEAIDLNLFQRIQEGIRAGVYRGEAFKSMISDYFEDKIAANKEDIPDYDNLDVFINGLLPINELPQEIIAKDPEMVFYQKTPARIIFELARKIDIGQEDVFYDLGSGLGQVCILLNLLSGIKTTGIEFEPSYSQCARTCAADLKLDEVTFINTDARAADYNDGTIFFMYTPFEGKIMEQVLGMLRKVSERRKIKIFTYGPCTPIIAKLDWLIADDADGYSIYRLCGFRSY